MSPVGAQKLTAPSLKYGKFSFFGFFTCLLTLVLAFLFKEYLINILSYLEKKSSSNLIEFHFILIILFILMSLPVLSPYIVCVLICSYVYGFFCGFSLVVIYTVIGMTCSFFICRYMFFELAHSKVRQLAYLDAICSLIQSNEQGYKIIFLSRLMPLPFGLANLAFAVTNVKFGIYILASAVGLLPSQLIICYMGSTLKSMSDVLANESTAKTASFVFVFQLIIAIFVMYYILHAAKIELQKHIDNDNKIDENNLAVVIMRGNATSAESPDKSSINKNNHHVQNV